MQTGDGNAVSTKITDGIQQDLDAVLPGLCWINFNISFVCWFGSLNVSDRKIILRIAKQCGKIVGKKDIDLVNLYKKRVILRSKKILCDPLHYMYQLFETLPSNTRFRAIKCKTISFQNTFFPTAKSKP